MKVYLWQGTRHDGSRYVQTNEIVAAKSKAAAARAAGKKDPRSLFNFGVTGNDQQIAVAMSEPGAVFWAPLPCSGPTRREDYRKAEGPAL